MTQYMVKVEMIEYIHGIINQMLVIGPLKTEITQLMVRVAMT